MSLETPYRSCIGNSSQRKDCRRPDLHKNEGIHAVPSVSVGREIRSLQQGAVQNKMPSHFLFLVDFIGLGLQINAVTLIKQRGYVDQTKHRPIMHSRQLGRLYKLPENLRNRTRRRQIPYVC